MSYRCNCEGKEHNIPAYEPNFTCDECGLTIVTCWDTKHCSPSKFRAKSIDESAPQVIPHCPKCGGLLRLCFCRCYWICDKCRTEVTTTEAGSTVEETILPRTVPGVTKW